MMYVATCCKCGRSIKARDLKSYEKKAKDWRYIRGTMEWFCPKCSFGTPLKGPGSRRKTRI